ncbi:response regulator [Gephyromycinifex aptenodytis]|uniref:response regulator n=1 Tax=Gephyromycinifex aptenodytis TaxID=2716227 RepID=UPI0014475ABE|nr:response regulator [Gephyromycinifex aptenodytis]
MRGPRTVLIADSDSMLRALLAARLTEAGYAVDPVADGEQAWTSIVEHDPDLAVLDIGMPSGSGLSGLELLRRVRDDERTKNLPVILLGSPRVDEQLEAGVACGATDVVRKPLNGRDLVRRISRLLGPARVRI